jgi:hypothetical protein
MSGAAKTLPLIPALLLLLLGSLTRPSLAQTTVGTASIVETVSDPSGAVISGPQVTISNVATGQVVRVKTNASGSFNSGALLPGVYKALTSAKGFSSAEVIVTVLVGNTATLNMNLYSSPPCRIESLP